MENEQMSQMSVMSVVNLMPSNKEQLAVFKKGIKDAIVDGDVDPLKALQQLKMIEKVLDVLTDKDVEKTILAEAQKYHRQELSELNGSKYEIKEVGVKYDFSVCNDNTLTELLEKKADLDDKIKQRRDFLKTIPQDTDTYGADGVCLCRPAKSSTTKVVITV